MAIEITKRCTPPTEKEWVGKCSTCSSEAKCLRSDLTHYHAANIRGEAFSWEACPVCGAGVDADGHYGICFHEAEG